MQDVWAGRREQLSDGIARSLGTIEFSHGQLVREQIEAAEPADYEMAALACIAAAESVGSQLEAAVPGAVSIALMSQMGLVFAGLENSGGAASLSTAWGMPRALNAGDAMFALAQDALLSMPDEITPEVRLRAAELLDAGARALVDSLLAADGADVSAAGQRALLAPSMALGGLLAGADAHSVERLEQLGREWSRLPAEQLSRQLASDPAGWLET